MFSLFSWFSSDIVCSEKASRDIPYNSCGDCARCDEVRAEPSLQSYPEALALHLRNCLILQDEEHADHDQAKSLEYPIGWST
jgi:hypothetical protein